MTAKIIEDSISPAGDRLTTFELEIHRFVLAEFNTHRVFSRNSASSRAIPFARSVQAAVENTATPVAWRMEQSGMQGGQELSADRQRAAQAIWVRSRDHAIAHAKHLHSLGVHKSIVNRILEPYQMHRVIVSATDYDGWFEQRCSPLAQPEIRVVADAMRVLYDSNEPRRLDYGDWHMPYLDPATVAAAESLPGDPYDTLRKVSAARCARVSYLTHDGVRDIDKDVELFERLTSARPGHWSPLEHVATPDRTGRGLGNFRGWRQLRHDYDR